MAKKILIVEDDQIIVKYLKELFENNGYETIIAYDGTEAEDAVKQNPDLITLDLQMPKEWGPRFYRKMRKSKELKDIPVIVISGFWKDPKHAIKNAVAVFSKPFDEDKLLSTVKHTIGL